ncbi:DUF1800 domain-containing protein [Paenibacillus tianmuensis]|nr:DUF1800 domain-containing protein [Paenibacillus tianmuensis]
MKRFLFSLFFRSHELGSFRDLVLEIGKDPAMMVERLGFV